jgi:two-component system, LytTR family, sensor kinase
MQKMNKLFSRSIIRISLHILAWAILLGIPLYLIKRWDAGKDFVWVYYTNTLISGTIFYVSYLFLIPRFFFKNRIKYYISAAILIVAFYFVSDQSNRLIFKYIPDQNRIEETNRSTDANKQPEVSKLQRREPHGRPPFRQIHLFNYAFTSLFLIFFSLGLRMIERNDMIEKRQKELEKEKLNSELAFLKNQISPHFFFNTLNNIYSLIGINTEDAQNAVLKLSKLMRYLLYDSEQGLSQLSSEIDFMNNYIDLMRLRMSEKVKLHVDFPSKFENTAIPPLLFIPFIENAFKHGISYREKSFIDISMEVGKEWVTFSCRNSVVKPFEEIGTERSGIGLDNVSKRLNLLFPGRHDLKIDRSNAVFHVILRIMLNNA